jgi:HD-like signal output (HDOD) protein
MDKKQIFSHIAASASDGELAFPTHARLAMKLREALENPDCSMETAARLVQAEPLLSARIVSMANSVVYNRSGNHSTDVRMAVMRLGFGTVRTLAMALVTRQLAGSGGPPELQKIAAQLWEHTAHVASLAHLIARRVTHVDPEAALFTGIVHEIGGFYMLSCAARHPGLLEGDWTDWVASGRAEVGRAVLHVLNAPEMVLNAVESFWEGYLALPPRTLGDTLLIAEELAPVVSPLSVLGALKPSGDASSDLEMLIGKETLTSILEASAEDVRSLTMALTA